MPGGLGRLFWLQPTISRNWDRFGEIYEQHHGVALQPGEKRTLVLNIHIEDTHEKAWEMSRDGHDEFWKFLAPYGWSKGYMAEDGKPAQAGLIPTLEQSVEQGVWNIGSSEEVAERIANYKTALGLRHFTIVPQFPGDSYVATGEQMARYMEEVHPLVQSGLSQSCLRPELPEAGRAGSHRRGYPYKSAPVTGEVVSEHSFSFRRHMTRAREPCLPL